MMKLRHTPISIAAGPVWLEALQAHSPDADGLILIAQNSVGNHRNSREAHFAHCLQNAGFATLIGMPIGLLASSTGSAAAVRALAKDPELVSALVCRGGRPGLAGISPLRQVSCPTLMIVGDKDEGLGNIRQAYDLLGCTKAWRDVPGTDDYFREPGALDDAATLAAEWFHAHLAITPAQRALSSALAASDSSQPATPDRTTLGQ